MSLLWITIPFAIVGGIFAVMSETTDAGFWRAMDFAIYAGGVAMLWAVTVVGYLIWIVLRDGWQTSSIPAMVILALVVTGAAYWVWTSYIATTPCEAAHDFYGRLAGLPAAERRVAIRESGDHIRAPSSCALEGLRTWFGLDPAPPEGGGAPLGDAERLDALQQMLDAGLPPNEGVLTSFAAMDADAAATRLILQQRRKLKVERNADWELFPVSVASHALSRAHACNGGDPGEEAARYRNLLRTLVEVGRPDAASLDAEMREELTCLGLLPTGQD